MKLFAVGILAVMMVSTVSGMGTKSKVEKNENRSRKVRLDSKVESSPPVAVTAPIKLIENSPEENKAIELQIAKPTLKKSKSTTVKPKASGNQKAKNPPKGSPVSKKNAVKAKRKIPKNKSKK